MKKNAVVFTISSDLIFAVANIILDIKKMAPLIADEVVILHNGISQKDLTLLNSIIPVREIEYNIPVDDLSKFNQNTLNYFTIMAYAKFECIKLLEDYKNVIYLDPDMVILKDLSNLLEYCDSGIKMMPGNVKVREQLHNVVDKYNMETEGICGCIFVFQDHINDYMKLYNFCISSLNKYAGRLYLAEQGIFDFMLQEYRLDYCILNRDVYSPHPTEINLLDNAKIIHAYGQPKFWNGLENEQWNKNYQEWLRMGGSAYKKKNFFSKIKNKLFEFFRRTK